MENPFKWEDESKGLPFVYNPVTAYERKKSEWKPGTKKISTLSDFEREIKERRLRSLHSKNASAIIDDYDIYVDKPKEDIKFDDYWLKLDEIKLLKKLKSSEDMTL